MEGIVLRRIDYGESDQVVKIFLKELGCVSGIAKGIKRSKKRFPHRLEPFRVFDFTLGRKKPGQGLYFIQAADQLRDFEGIKEDIQKIALGNLILEMVLVSVKEEHAHPDLYAFILECFQALCDAGEIAPLWFYAEIHIMRLLGFSPNFETCLTCKSPIQKSEDNIFDASGGGVVCPRCRPRHLDTTRPVTSGPLGVLQFLKRVPPGAVSRVRISDTAREEIASLLAAFITYHLERPLKSLPFLSELMAG